MKTLLPNETREISRLNSIFANLENGNLDDAKRLAKRYSAFRLSMFARQILFWSFDRSKAAASFLKGEGTFQSFCDAAKE